MKLLPCLSSFYIECRVYLSSYIKWNMSWLWKKTYFYLEQAMQMQKERYWMNCMTSLEHLSKTNLEHLSKTNLGQLSMWNLEQLSKTIPMKAIHLYCVLIIPMIHVSLPHHVRTKVLTVKRQISIIFFILNVHLF